MAVKHALLGLLLERRGYGYDLMRRLEERLGPAWQLNPSTVYAALDQLEEDGWIVAGEPPRQEPVARERRRVRRVVYEVTAEGVAAFESWVGRPSADSEPIRGELQLKVATARSEDAPRLLDAIDHAELLARLLLKECGEEAPSGDGGAARELPRLAAACRLEGELRWLRAARAALAKKLPDPEGPGSFPLPEATG